MEQPAGVMIATPRGQTAGDGLSGAIARDFLSVLLEQSPAGIALLHGADLRIHLANERFRGLLGEVHRSAAIVGLRLVDVVPGAKENELADIVRQARRTGCPASRAGLRLATDDGREVYWDVTAAPLRDPGAGRSLVALQVVDVTEARLAREEHARLVLVAEQRTEQFGAALERISDGVVVVDTDGKVRRINAAAIALLDLDSPAEGGQAPLEQAQGAEPSGRYRVDLPQLHLSLHGQTIRDAEHDVVRRNGETTSLSVSTVPLYDRDGSVRGAVAALHDIGERRRLVQLKDEFLTVTAHELRTPVTALLGYTNLLVRRAEQGDWTERDLHALRMIETQAQRLTQLVNGLIDVSHVQTGSIELQRQRVELGALIGQAVAASRTRVVDHAIEVDLPEQPVLVWGDPQRLDQVVTHLIGNALKYSPWGGVIRVRVAADSAARITVSDDGIGIPSDALPQLFERFYRATNVDTDRISGLGIGLYLVKQLVVAHDGEIEVKSSAEKGTTFEISLPLLGE